MAFPLQLSMGAWHWTDIVIFRNATFFVRHNESPVLHQARYLASLHLPSQIQPAICLQYIVLALGATISATYRPLAEPFYKRSRQYLEADELKVSGYRRFYGAFGTFVHA